MSRWVAGLVTAVAVLCVATPASAAPPDPEPIICARSGGSPHGTQFEVKGGGTFLGGWAVNGTNASLCFRGAAPAGGSIVAKWTTPWSGSNKGYDFRGTYDFDTLNPNGAVILAVSSRFQARGEKWDAWTSFFRQRSRPPAGSGGAGFGEGVLFVRARGAPHAPPPT